MKRILGAAALVALVMVATIAVVRIIDAGSSSPSRPEVTSATMIGHHGHEAGHAYLTAGSERYVFLDVDYGVKTGMYRIDAVDGLNHATKLGMVAITAGHGTWAGELPPGSSGTPAMVRLVDEDGSVLCAAHFDAEV